MKQFIRKLYFKYWFIARHRLGVENPPKLFPRWALDWLSGISDLPTNVWLGAPTIKQETNQHGSK